MRLQRIGRRNDASFRVIVTDSRRGPKSGKHIDLLGSYNPKMNQVTINGEKAKEWIAKGVQVSDTVHNLLVGEKIIEGKKINVLPKKSPIINEEAHASEKGPEEGDTVEVEDSPETKTEDAPQEEAASVEENVEKEEAEVDTKESTEGSSSTETDKKE